MTRIFTNKQTKPYVLLRDIFYTLVCTRTAPACQTATDRSKLTYLDIIGWYIHVITSYAEWYNFQPPPQMCE